MAVDQQATPATEWRKNWGLVSAGMLGISLSALTAGSIGVMMEPIEQDLGWSRTEIFSGMSLVSVICMSLMTVMGVAIDRIGPRWIGIAAAACLCGSVALLGTFSGGLWQWWAIWALIGIASAAMPTVWIAPITRAFTASRGLAVAIALSGSGISMFFVPVVANTLVEQYGWRVGYFGLAAIWSLISLPVVALCFRGSAVAPTAVAMPANTQSAPEQLPGLTARQAFLSRTYYTLLLATFCGILGSIALSLNLVPVLTFTGLSRGAAAPIAGLVGLSTIVGRIAGGWLMDHISAKVIAATAVLLAAILPAALLLFPGSIAAATAGVIAFGLGGGAKVAAIPYLTSRHLGARAFGTLYGSINAILALAGALAPLAANYIYDLTDTYTPVMLAAVPLLALSAIFYLSLGPYPDFGRDKQ